MVRFANNKHNDVQSITPNWAVSSIVKVFSTTRVGGVSEAPFDTLNLGLHVHDNEQHVWENRARVEQAIEAPGHPLWLNQVHGHEVIFVDDFHQFDDMAQADGSFTRTPSQVLCVGTADCLPVVIANVEGTAVAVVHAGWRGLVAGVVQSGLAHFADNDELHAWLGPAIGPLAFEVGADVVDAFLQRDKQNAAAFKPAGRGKFMADLYHLARLELQRERPVVVTGGDYCTHTQRDLFHSHRRDGVASGRMATFAWIE